MSKSRFCLFVGRQTQDYINLQNDVLLYSELSKTSIYNLGDISFLLHIDQGQLLIINRARHCLFQPLSEKYENT